MILPAVPSPLLIFPTIESMFAELKSHLRGSPCRAFVEGYKVQVADDEVLLVGRTDLPDVRSSLPIQQVP